MANGSNGANGKTSSVLLWALGLLLLGSVGYSTVVLSRVNELAAAIEADRARLRVLESSLARLSTLVEVFHRNDGGPK